MSASAIFSASAPTSGVLFRIFGEAIDNPGQLPEGKVSNAKFLGPVEPFFACLFDAWQWKDGSESG